jgi:thioredoxin-like negative regulator of GroEL
MKKQPFNLFVGVSLVAVAGGFIFFRNGLQATDTKQVAQDTLQMDLNNYLDYSDSILVSAQQKGQPILFFAATTWCQTCSALEEEILERQSEIPTDVTILKVDYDNNKLMNQKWQVTAQHTLIVLDEEGQEVKRWLGGDFDSLLREVEAI